MTQTELSGPPAAVAAVERRNQAERDLRTTLAAVLEIDPRRIARLSPERAEAMLAALIANWNPTRI